MAARKRRAASAAEGEVAGTESESSGEIIVKRSEDPVPMIFATPEFQEPDMLASKETSNPWAGENPYPAGSARAQGWDYLQQLNQKGM
jgi:hypothetical protein